MRPSYTPIPLVRLTHPEWSKNAVINQINTRQFTPEGTFRAAETHLSRLKDYAEYMSGQLVELTARAQIELQPWGYQIFVK